MCCVYVFESKVTGIFQDITVIKSIGFILSLVIMIFQYFLGFLLVFFFCFFFFAEKCLQQNCGRIIVIILDIVFTVIVRTSLYCGILIDCIYNLKS